jgi:hypothetical protein
MAARYALRAPLVSTLGPKPSLVSNASAPPRFQPVVSVRLGKPGNASFTRVGSLVRLSEAAALLAESEP